MPSPFAGMDPHLVHPALWPDIDDSLLSGPRDARAPFADPRGDMGLGRRTHLLLGTVLAGLYDRARYDLRLDYTKPLVSPLAAAAAWSPDLVARTQG